MSSGYGAPERIFYDNYIVGGAYQRDFFQFNSGLLLGAEVGLADRFGHYSVCCNTIVYSNKLVQSAEFWAGASFRTSGFALFDAVKVSPGFVFGLSFISNPIGQEGEHQIIRQGSAKMLLYLGFDSGVCPRQLAGYRIGASVSNTALAPTERWEQ